MIKMTNRTKEESKIYMRKWRSKNKDKVREYNKTNILRNRLKVMDMLGGRKCVKCGCIDIRCLQIDHINGDRKREKYTVGGSRMYYIQIRRNIENGSKNYQILCANCNFIKRYENKEYGDGKKIA